jgi:peptide/nickel transport system substrate-binding protein
MLSKNKLSVLFAILIITSMLLSACQPEKLIETVIITQVVEKEGQTIVTTQIVEVEVTPTAVPPEPENPFTKVSPEFKNADSIIFVDGAGEQETLDPAWTYETRGAAIEDNIYEGLVWFVADKTDEFVPMLATEWTVNDTGDVWIFNIREGVTFHEGGTLEPHDVAYSLHRALLQDRIDGPHWMTLEAFFGEYAIEDIATGLAEVDDFADVPEDKLAETCEMVKGAIVADDDAGTVTFNLYQSTPWLLAMMTNSFMGAVLDQEWMVDNGDWDGSCDSWVQFHDPAAQDTILFDRANGTGPYMLDYWTPGEETVLVANENYWRTEPMWEGGPSGIASIKRVVLKNITEWGTRLAMMEAGDADWIYVPNQYRPQLEDYILTQCDAAGNCAESNPDGYIQAWRGLPTVAMTPAQYNWNINIEGGNPFVGSGALDGNGIPPDFFSDIHVRKAFLYCFDFATMIKDGLNDEGIQAQGPIIAGMMGYREGEAPLYSYDPAMCESEFKAAFDGELWDSGFYMQLAYNEGNDTRRTMAEILKAGVESVNPNFSVQVLSMPWPVLLNTRRAQKLPIYIGGWQEDFHDPHNWVHPFLHSQGAYGRVINMGEELAAEFDAMINEAASVTDMDQRRELYEAIQLKSQEDAVILWGYQPVDSYYFQKWIQGYYYNPALPESQYAYVYALTKTAP